MRIEKYELVDDSHPIFNLWNAVGSNGVLYTESFYKNEDPNKMSKSDEKIEDDEDD